MVRWTEAAVAALRTSMLTPWRARTLLKSSEQDLLRVYTPERDWRVTLGGAAMLDVEYTVFAVLQLSQLKNAGLHRGLKILVSWLLHIGRCNDNRDSVVII